MKIDEIFDREEHQRRLDAAMKSIARQYAPRPRRSPEEEAKKKAEWDQYRAKRDSIEKIAGEVAAKYTGDQFEQFKAEVANLIPASDLKMIDLNTVWHLYNPDAMEVSRKSWDDYGKRRAAGDPSIVGIGPSGARNWTGD